MIDRRVSIAPMMECTDKHDRYFLRLISPQVLLYTEMITTGALIHGDSQRFLHYDMVEKPLALQLGGSDPDELAICAKMAENYGYDEVNLNVGCPSDRVKSGAFGACLMLQPQRVAACVAAMGAKVLIPITVKCRIGVDHQDSYAELVNFIKQVANAGCNTFIIHARKAWLNGLSPKQNREIPPLRYDIVYQLKQDYPHLNIVINGGIKTSMQVKEHLKYVDGVMIGREAYANPYLLAELEKQIFLNEAPLKRNEIIGLYLPYIAQQLTANVKLSSISRHILGLYKGQQKARAWRRYISEHACLAGAGVSVIEQALILVNEERHEI